MRLRIEYFRGIIIKLFYPTLRRPSIIVILTALQIGNIAARKPTSIEKNRAIIKVRLSISKPLKKVCRVLDNPSSIGKDSIIPSKPPLIAIVSDSPNIRPTK
jgi:hypothetical protein